MRCRPPEKIRLEDPAAKAKTGTPFRSGDFTKSWRQPIMTLAANFSRHEPGQLGGGQCGPILLFRNFLRKAPSLDFRRSLKPLIKRWTSEEIAKLKRMAKKYPAAKIAEELGRGFPATRVKAHQLGLSLRLKNERRGVSKSDRRGKEKFRR